MLIYWILKNTKKNEVISFGEPNPSSMELIYRSTVVWVTLTTNQVKENQKSMILTFEKRKPQQEKHKIFKKEAINALT